MPILPITAIPRQLAPSVFMTNNIPTSALQTDPRFQYAAYVPDKHYPQSADSTTKLPVIVAVHGTSRTHNRYLNVWREFADNHRCAVIAPLFPAFVASPLDLDGYSYLGKSPHSAYERLLKKAVTMPGERPINEGHAGVRHDLIFLAMLDEVTARWPALDTQKIALIGFSGGAQFAHRFLYLYPERLFAVSVGAPGRLTQLDATKPWPLGIQDIETVFGRNVDVEALKGVPILASVGAEDSDTDKTRAGISLKGGAVAGTDDDANMTRLQKLTQAVERWREISLNVEFETVPDAKHEMEKVYVVVEPFIARHIQAWWSQSKQDD